VNHLLDGKSLASSMEKNPSDSVNSSFLFSSVARRV